MVASCTLQIISNYFWGENVPQVSSVPWQLSQNKRVVFCPDVNMNQMKAERETLLHLRQHLGNVLWLLLACLIVHDEELPIY